MGYLPCENPMKWALCCISIQQFLFPKGGIAAFFMPVGDVDKGQKPYYNDTRMQRELLREAERKDTSTFTPDLDNANGGNAGCHKSPKSVRNEGFPKRKSFFCLRSFRWEEEKRRHQQMGGNKDNHVLKMVLTAIFAGMGFALSSVVWFPNMAPFQHFINVLAAVFVGPYWGFLAALITGILRMMTGRTALAVIGAVIGAFLSGFLYRKSGHKLYMAVIGEIFGTGILSAFAAYPVMKYIYGMDLQTPWVYVPAFVPSSAMGAFLAVLVITLLKRSGMFARMMEKLNRK